MVSADNDQNTHRHRSVTQANPHTHSYIHLLTYRSTTHTSKKDDADDTAIIAFDNITGIKQQNCIWFCMSSSIYDFPWIQFPFPSMVCGTNAEIIEWNETYTIHTIWFYEIISKRTLLCLGDKAMCNNATLNQIENQMQQHIHTHM